MILRFASGPALSKQDKNASGSADFQPTDVRRSSNSAGKKPALQSQTLYNGSRNRGDMRLISFGLFVVCFVFFTVSAWAQQLPPKTPQLTTQFYFSPPGARSLGMGASFIGLADDATASESNPAGLVILNKPEVSANFRLASFDNEFPDTVAEQGSDQFNDTTTSVSFVSFVYPKGRTAFSLYYQQPGNFKSHSQFCCDSAALPGFTNTDLSNTRFRLQNIGVSGAVRLNSRCSVGGSLRLTQLNLQYGTFTIFTHCVPVPGSFPPECPIDQSIRV